MSSEVEDEKPIKGSDSEVKVDVLDATATIRSSGSDPENESFEWREVVRGARIVAHSLNLLAQIPAAVLDVQVWLCGVAALGTLVPLYSFSLFLYVWEATYDDGSIH